MCLGNFVFIQELLLFQWLTKTIRYWITIVVFYSRIRSENYFQIRQPTFVDVNGLCKNRRFMQNKIRFVNVACPISNPPPSIAIVYFVLVYFIEKPIPVASFLKWEIAFFHCRQILTVPFLGLTDYLIVPSTLRVQCRMVNMNAIRPVLNFLSSQTE